MTRKENEKDRQIKLEVPSLPSLSLDKGKYMKNSEPHIDLTDKLTNKDLSSSENVILFVLRSLPRNFDQKIDIKMNSRITRKIMQMYQK